MGSRRFLITAVAISIVAVALSSLPQAERNIRTRPAAAGDPKGKVIIENLGGPGESTRVTIRDYSWGITQTTSTAGGAGAGKATFDDFTFEKLVDTSSVALARAATQGLHFPSATATIYKPGTTTAQSVFTLTDVLISNVSHSYRSSNVESVSIAYASIEWIYKAPTGDQTFCWNLSLSAGC